jgi:hypothetical protein
MSFLIFQNKIRSKLKCPECRKFYVSLHKTNKDVPLMMLKNIQDDLKTEKPDEIIEITDCDINLSTRIYDGVTYRINNSGINKKFGVMIQMMTMIITVIKMTMTMMIKFNQI